MKKFLCAVLGFGMIAASVGCAPTGTGALAEPKGGYAQLKDAPASGEEIAVMVTNYGTIKMRFFPDLAPKAVENFLTHAKDGYYDGVIFHRIIEGFMIQGGDPDGTGMGGESIWGRGFTVEESPQLHNIRGAVSMARSQARDSNGSQFFIVQNNEVEPSTKVWLEQMKNKPDSVYRDMSGQMKRGDDGHYFANKEMFPTAFVDYYLNNGGSPFLDFEYTVFGQVFEGLDVVDKIAAAEKDSSDRPLEDVKIESVTVERY